jgi:hypothetical protein
MSEIFFTKKNLHLFETLKFFFSHRLGSLDINSLYYPQVNGTEWFLTTCVRLVRMGLPGVDQNFGFWKHKN